MGRYEETRTPDLYRVNFEVIPLQPFPHLAFLHPRIPITARKLAGFDGELMASFPPLRPTAFRQEARSLGTVAATSWDNFPVADEPGAIG